MIHGRCLCGAIHNMKNGFLGMNPKMRKAWHHVRWNSFPNHWINPVMAAPVLVIDFGSRSPSSSRGACARRASIARSCPSTRPKRR